MTHATAVLLALLVAPAPPAGTKKTTGGHALQQKKKKRKLGKRKSKKRVPKLHLGSSKRTPVAASQPQLPAGAKKPSTTAPQIPGQVLPRRLEFDLAGATDNTLEVYAPEGFLRIRRGELGGLWLMPTANLSLFAHRGWLQGGDIRLKCEGQFQRQAIELKVITIGNVATAEQVASLRFDRPTTELNAVLFTSELSHDFYRVDVVIGRVDDQALGFQVARCSLERLDPATP
ncbi:MAG: hypothetical protein AAF721_42300 [Myxococcota bacterium]